jgi:aspartyl-tRNA(Asn)/glutamyl-tRNA(Gln) amidotransferase subunit C
MVERKEIEHLGDLVRIELKAPEKFIKQVEEILNYFDKLDNVQFDSDQTLRNEISMENLRDDIHEPFENYGKLIAELKKDQNNYTRAPKMI